MRNGGGSFSSFSSFSFPFHSDSFDDKWGARKLFPPLVTFASSAKLKLETSSLFQKRKGGGGGSGMKGDMGENLLLLPPSLATFGGGGGGQEAITCSSRNFLLKTTISPIFLLKSSISFSFSGG